MKIVVAMDKFKGSLDAPTACNVVRDALNRQRPHWRIVTKPMADGGDGTARALIDACDGSWIVQQVTGPLGFSGQTDHRPRHQLPADKVDAGFAWFIRDRLAVVEMASASGLALLAPNQRDPLRTTTYGTGELLRGALDRGAHKIWLGVGGSTTVDGGVGAARALGWTFRDKDGEPIGHGGGELQRIHQIEPPATDPVVNITISVLCDVDNPLCGPRGAAHVFGPQKGASPEVVKQLDAGLFHLATLVRAQLGKDILDVPGAGAAGGLAGGALAFFGAQLVPGIETVMRATGLPDALRGAAWVITGEGRFDEQSLHGKVVSGVTQLARAQGVRVAVLAGTVAVDEATCRAHGVDVALAITPEHLTLAEGMERTQQLLAERVAELVGRL